MAKPVKTPVEKLAKSQPSPPDPEPFAPDPELILQIGALLFEVHAGGLRPCDPGMDVSSLTRVTLKAYQR